MSAPELKLSDLGETLIAGLGAVWIAWGWRAALGACGVYLLALAWKWVAG